MHILDVISSVSMSSKCTKIVGGWCVDPDLTGELTVLPDPYLGLRVPTSKAPTSKERCHMPRVPETPAVTDTNKHYSLHSSNIITTNAHAHRVHQN